MGSLYTQHFAPPRSSTASARPSFDVTYEGALASANTTKPLFAALLKGLLSPITSAESLNINLVNAEILARERGIRIPEDVLVIGWGDYPFSRFLDPPLSTLRLPSVEVARRASTRLLALLDGAAEREPVLEYVQPELVLRASTNRQS